MSSQKQGGSRGRQVALRDILASLGEDETSRQIAITRFKARGGDLNRWDSAAGSLMADALTAAEDALEMTGTPKARAMRAKLRVLRRRLEATL